MLMLNYSNTIDRVLANIRQMVPIWAGMQPGQKVLDVCCGTGAQAYIYAKHGMIATGLDNDLSMLSQNSGIIRLKAIESIDLVPGDAKQMPFKEGFFDWASIQFGLHEKPNEARLAIIREMTRVVKPAGYFIFVDFNYPLSYNFMGLGIKLIERMAGKEHYECFKDYHKRGGLVPLLQLSGMNVVKSISIKQRSITLIKATTDKQTII